MQQTSKKYLTFALVLLVTALAGVAGYQYLQNKRDAFLTSYEQRKAAEQAKETAIGNRP